MQRKKEAIKVTVFGVVQGVGFRPFIYRLAKKLELSGWVKNFGLGVEIWLESSNSEKFSEFLTLLEKDRPPLSLIKEIKVEQRIPQGFLDFNIKKSKAGEAFVFISPDIFVCSDCLKEMNNREDRRYRYPFINCTNCGPRYTIVKSLPYDRNKTSMKYFKMCSDCQKEYENPLDRRYHAQPIACPICGPHVELKEAKTNKKIENPIENAISLIRQGKILAIKGLGGFHLVCDAFNKEAVLRLRRIKQRKTKPFALMAKNIKIAKKFVEINPEEEKFLLSPQRPIVLLKIKKEIPDIAPFLKEFGIMLPYTPLHYLLMENLDLIVATSSNKKDAPIIKDENERIEELCDYILTHNRAIVMRADDSVMKVVNKNPLFLRRARGYVPYPQEVPLELKVSPHIIALGGELKDTISIYKNGYIVTSQFLGDLDEYKNFQYFEEALNHLTHLFEVKPKMVISDLHPDFRTTRFAQKMNIPHIQVQHHFAHSLAPMVEHNISPKEIVLGVSFDGFGYGEDGKAWGGEFLICNYSTYKRFAHFEYVHLPGGDLASKQPWRMALSYLYKLFGEDISDLIVFEKINQNKIKGVLSQIKYEINSPLTSSCGRLFDAVSFLLGIAPIEVEYEAEAPIRLEAVSFPLEKEFYEFKFLSKNPIQISFSLVINSILNDLKNKMDISFIASKFHSTIVQVIKEVALLAREKFGIKIISLSGGVFLNRIILTLCEKILKNEGFKVIRSINYSPNDESLSIGQIAYALNKLKELKK
jgi:hydrogenase maturation protein HypF